MRKLHLIKAVMLGICLSALSTGAVSASTADSSKAAEVTTKEAKADSELEKLQAEIDQYVFVDHFEEIEKSGFTVTRTGPVDSYIEIGIAPYSDENAAYLYDIFGKDKVKVVEGIEAVLYIAKDAEETKAETGTKADKIETAEPDKAADVAKDDEVTTEVSKKIMEKLDAVTKILSEENASQLEEKGIAIAQTEPLKDYVEVGILPYNKKNADYIYSLIGDENVKVVEGNLMYTTGIADGNIDKVSNLDDTKAAEVVSVTNQASADDTADKTKKMPIVIIGIAGVAILLGGTVLLAQKKNITK